MANFVQITELNRALDDKADMETIHEINAQKASQSEIEQIRKLIDRLAFEVEGKPSFKDIDQMASNHRSLIEEIHKELVLKASIKDTSALLDQKVNVGDMN